MFNFLKFQNMKASQPHVKLWLLHGVGTPRLGTGDLESHPLLSNKVCKACSLNGIRFVGISLPNTNLIKSTVA